MNKRKTLIPFTSLCMFSALSPNAHSVVFEATHDSYIRSGASADTNYDARAYLRVASRGTGSDRKAYLNFDLSGQLGANEEFSNTAFSLTTRDAAGILVGPATGTVTLNVYGVTDGDDSWTESGITWNNAPKNDGSSNGVSAAGTILIGTLSIDSTTVVVDTQYSVTGAALDNYLNWAAGAKGDFYGTGVNSDITPTLIVTSAGLSSDPGFNFWSSESTGLESRQPQLSFDVTTAAIPEASDIGLIIGGAALSLVALRRRKA